MPEMAQRLDLWRVPPKRLKRGIFHWSIFHVFVHVVPPSGYKQLIIRWKSCPRSCSDSALLWKCRIPRQICIRPATY